MTAQEFQLIQLAHWMSNPVVAFGFFLLAIWTISWKGAALWKAAKNNQVAWYVVLLVANTAGILEIIYIFFFAKKKEAN